MSTLCALNICQAAATLLEHQGVQSDLTIQEQFFHEMPAVAEGEVRDMAFGRSSAP